MKKWKKIAVVLGIVSLSMCGGLTAFAGQWHKDGQGWWYGFEDGTYAADQWLRIIDYDKYTTSYYYFDSDGYMLENTATPDGHRVGADGNLVMDGSYTLKNSIYEMRVPDGGYYTWYYDGTVTGFEGSFIPDTALFNGYVKLDLEEPHVDTYTFYDNGAYKFTSIGDEGIGDEVYYGTYKRRGSLVDLTRDSGERDRTFYIQDGKMVFEGYENKPHYTPQE